MKTLVLLLAAALLATTGCKSLNPETGQREYDPVKTEKVVAAIHPVISDPLRRSLENSPQNAPLIAEYLRGVGGVFCAMKANKKFTPEFLIDALNSLAVPKIKDSSIITVKNSLVALYKIFYAEAHSVNLPEGEFFYHLADLFCSAIDQALRDAGMPGVSGVSQPGPRLIMPLHWRGSPYRVVTGSY